MAVTTSTHFASAAEHPSRAWWAALAYIAAVALFLRFYDLPLKPLHHDEGVNTLFLTTLVRPPHAYRYDPANYHGPTLYYLGWLSTAVFGLTTVAIRMVTAVAGLGAVLLLLGLKRALGAGGALMASALLAVSPGAVFFSRYYIHEMPLVCFTLAAVVCAWYSWDSGRLLPKLGAAASAALMFATKETAIISAFAITVAAAGSAFLVNTRGQDVRRRSDAQGGSSLAHVTAPLAVFIAVSLLFYTSLFTHWQGALDAVRSFAFWSRTGTSAHTHPWFAYLSWLRAEELPLLLLGSAGILVALWRRDSAFAVFAAIWALVVFTTYSAIPYKTPWLVTNLILPLTITAGYVCELAWIHRRSLSRVTLVSVFVAALGVATYQSVVLNFLAYDDDRNAYVYAHTFRDVLRLVDAVHAIEARHPSSSIAVTSPDHFPLSWYLRDYPSGYYGREVVTGDPIIVASVHQRAFFDRALGESYQRFGEYRLRPGAGLLLYVRRDLQP